MNKQELITRLAEKEEITKKEATIRMESVLATIQEVLQEGEEVNLYKFLTIKVVEVEERKGRNPKTSEEIIIPAHKKLKAKFSKCFKETL